MGVLATVVKTHGIESLIDYLSLGTGAHTCMAAHSGESEVSLPVIGVNVMDVAIEAVLKELSSIEFNEFLSIVSSILGRLRIPFFVHFCLVIYFCMYLQVFFLFMHH